MHTSLPQDRIGPLTSRLLPQIGTDSRVLIIAAMTVGLLLFVAGCSMGSAEPQEAGDVDAESDDRVSQSETQPDPPPPPDTSSTGPSSDEGDEELDRSASSWVAAWESGEYEVLQEWYRANTGIAAAGLTESDLEVVNGNVSTDRDGQVIEGKLIYGGVDVRHDRVTIRNSMVIGSGIGIDVSYSNRDNVDEFYVENVSLIGDPATIADPNDSPGRGIGATYARVHAKQVYVEGRGAGMRLSSKGGDTVTLSMIENIVTRPGSHNTGISFRGGDGTSITRSWIEGSTSSALSLYPDAAPITNFTARENLFDGGSYSVLAGDSKKYGGDSYPIQFIDNLFSDAHEFGPRTNWAPDRTGNRWTGNTYLDGQPVS